MGSALEMWVKPMMETTKRLTALFDEPGLVDVKFFVQVKSDAHRTEVLDEVARILFSVKVGDFVASDKAEP